MEVCQKSAFELGGKMREIVPIGEGRSSRVAFNKQKEQCYQHWVTYYTEGTWLLLQRKTSKSKLFQDGTCVEYCFMQKAKFTFTRN